MKNLKKPPKSKKIKLITTDIDGVLTDGKIIILESGEIKEWDTCDRLAFTIPRSANISDRVDNRKEIETSRSSRLSRVHYLYKDL